MIPQPMTGTAHEDGRSWMGIEVYLDQPRRSGGDRYDPLRGVPVAELEVIKSKEKLRHG